MILLFAIAVVGMLAVTWVIRRILYHFNDRIDTLERQMNVLLPPTR